MVVALSLVLLAGTSQAASISFKGLPKTVGPGESITFEVWLDDFDVALADIAAFGLWIGVSPGGTWDLDYIKSETLANPDYLFYGNSGFFDAVLKDGGIFISDVYNIDPALAKGGVKLASLKLDQEFPVCTDISFFLLDSGWSYVIDSELVTDAFAAIDASVHVVPLPSAVLLLGSGLIGLLGLRRRMRG
jgi:hypothetical protein